MTVPSRTGSLGPYFLSIDLGTSSIRTLVFDRRGDLTGSASAPLSVEIPENALPLAKILDPNTTWTVICKLVRRALQDAGIRGNAITAVSATSQREGTCFLDATGSELYMGPNTDLRALMEGQAIDERHRQQVYRITGHLPSFLFAPAKMTWLRQNHPALFDRMAMVLSLDGWISHKLTGVAAMELSAAAESGLLDVARGTWALSLLQDMSLPGDVLPNLVQAGTPLGPLTPEAASATGLTTNCVVVAAGPDTQCGLLGLGATSNGQIGVVAGWSAPVQLVLDEFLLDSEIRTWTGRHVVPEFWVLESSAAEAGSAYSWLTRTVATDGASDIHSFVARQADKAPPGSNGAVAMLGPAAANMGSIGPRVGGLLFPLLSTTYPVEKADLFRATLENLAFAIKANIDQAAQISNIAASSVAFGGGMAQNRTLKRILADVLGRELRVSRQSEVTGLGAAMCAATGLGEFSNLREAAAGMVKPARSIHPNKVTTIEYQEHYARWQSIGAVLDSLTDTL